MSHEPVNLSQVLVSITLVPVEVFTGLCDHDDCPNPDHLDYGLSDAVSAWSDCNRAAGRIYRVDDLPPGSRLPGDSITLHITTEQAEWFNRKFGADE